MNSIIKLKENDLILLVMRTLLKLWRRNNRYSNARVWSNDELKKFSEMFTGDVINISAGKDSDKEGCNYKNYFVNASSYSISNYKKELINESNFKEIVLDLNNPIESDSNLLNKYDVVFSHTVLEHVYDMKTAVKNLCKMSKDIVITVVPFIQAFHHEETVYHDYWRFSPYALINLFKELSFSTVYMNWNNDFFGNIYILHIASKHPEKWGKIQSLYHHNQNGPGYDRQTLLNNNIKSENGLLKQFDFSK